MGTKPSDHDYTVGWVCVLQTEIEAARMMLEEEYEKRFGDEPDNNFYILGRMGSHNVVIACLPAGDEVSSHAAVVATRMMGKFRNIKFGLLVGIGGGLRSERDDIRLGDVVVSKPDGTYGGVVQFDLGKMTPAGFVRTGYLNSPPERLRAVLNIMPRHGTSIKNPVSEPYPGEESDMLFKPTYNHVSDNTCERCDKQQQVRRKPGNRQDKPCVFYGTIASGNLVIKEAAYRETLIEKHGVLCCEMEAAGLMNSSFPCLVIRGISDYADSHKNDKWQDYAAAAAARYAKDFLGEIPPKDVHDLSPIKVDPLLPPANGSNAGLEKQEKEIGEKLDRLVDVAKALAEGMKEKKASELENRLKLEAKVQAIEGMMTGIPFVRSGFVDCWDTSRRPLRSEPDGSRTRRVWYERFSEPFVNEPSVRVTVRSTASTTSLGREWAVFTNGAARNIGRDGFELWVTCGDEAAFNTAAVTWVAVGNPR